MANVQRGGTGNRLHPVSGSTGGVARERRESLRRRLSIAVFGPALAAALLIAALPAQAVVVNRVIATVDGEPITAHQLDVFIRNNTRGVDPATIAPGDREKVLQVMINDMLVQMESQAVGIAPPEAEVDAYIEQIKKTNSLDDERLLAALQAQGLTMEQYRAQIRKEIQRSQLLARQIRSRVNITPQDVERYYESHKDEFGEPEAVTVRHIFFRVDPAGGPEGVQETVRKANEAAARLRKGEDFEQVAREMSEGPEADKGGLIGTIHKGQMLPELEEVAFTLKKDGVSEPVRSPVGVHILKVDERDEPSATKLEDVQEKIKEKLYAQAIEERYQRWIEEDLRKGHAVEVK